MTNYVIIDLETHGHKTFKRFCNPLDINHYIVAVAYKFKGQEAQVDYCRGGIPPNEAFKNIDLTNVDVIIGQNFKFDLLYLWHSTILQDWLKAGGRIYCTLQAEYHLRGQQGVVYGKDDGAGKMDLDALSLKYGGTVKDSGVKEVWKNGGTVLDIPKDQLIEYAAYDVINTEIVLRGQLKQLAAKGMTALVGVYNEHLLACTEYEYNGMYFNAEKAMQYAAKLEIKLEGMRDQLTQLITDNNVWPQEMLAFNMNSPIHMANLLFGGGATVTQKAPMLQEDGEAVRFKSGAKVGQVRTRNEKVDILIPGLNEAFDEAWKTDAGGRGTSGDVIKEVSTRSKNKITQDVIGALLEYRAGAKLLSTYLYKKKPKGDSGLVPLVHPDGCIHAEYETTFTETGRLSSRNPNAQNIPPVITELFESRYGKDGSMIELDFSQLEIVVQAYVTQCPKMIEDIKAGVDFHCLRLSYAEGMDYEEVYNLCQSEPRWKLKRKKAKVISFQKAYGAHPSKIAKEVDLPEDVIMNVFDKENHRYPEIQAYYDGITEYLDSNCYETDRQLDVRYDGKYFPHPRMKEVVGQYQTITGKLYTFTKKAVKTKRGIFQYWPGPNIMNYPIQGTAADIVAMQAGKVFRYMIHNRDKGLMVNEIHDSIVLDVKDEYVEEITKNVKEILESVKESFKEKFNLKFNAPIGVDAGSGKTWSEAK